MSGELTIKNDSGLAKRLLGLVITAAVVLAVTVPLLRSLAVRSANGEPGLMTQVAMAILVPVLIWLLHPQMMNLLPGGKQKNATLRWTIQNSVLTLGDREIPLSSIKMVHCWQKGDSWTVNIETTGRNQLLRSAEGEEAARSVRQLYALVDALGYRSQWREV